MGSTPGKQGLLERELELQYCLIGNLRCPLGEVQRWRDGSTKLGWEV